MIGIRTKQIIADTIIYIILIAMSVIWLLPIIWLVGNSFNATVTQFPQTFLPSNYSFNAYKQLFTETAVINFPRWFLNTFIVAIFTCIIATILVLMVSYALSRLRFKMRKPFMNIGIILGLFPSFMSMIAIYFLFKEFKMTGNLVGLVMVYSLASGLGYFIVKGFFDTIPAAIDEAARIDGASRNRIFWQMTIPLSKPIIIYTVLTSFLGPWFDFVTASVMLKDNVNSYTVSIGLRRMLQREYIDRYFTQFCAGAVLVSIPITVLFIIMQRYYVEGITGGSAKG